MGILKPERWAWRQRAGCKSSQEGRLKWAQGGAEFQNGGMGQYPGGKMLPGGGCESGEVIPWRWSWSETLSNHPALRNRAPQSWPGGEISDTPAHSVAILLYLIYKYQTEGTGTHLSCRPMPALLSTWRGSTLLSIAYHQCLCVQGELTCCIVQDLAGPPELEGTSWSYTASPPLCQANITNLSQHYFL